LFVERRYLMTYFDQISRSLGPMGPNIIWALIVLVVGWVLALIISSFVGRALGRTGWDEKLARRVYGDEKAKTVEAGNWISKIVYYLLLLFVLVVFFEVLGLTIVVQPLNQLLTEIFAYAPRILAAAVLALIAWLLAYALKRIVLSVLRATKVDERTGEESGAEVKAVPVSQTVAEAVYWLVWLLFLPMILDALNLGGLLAPVQLLIAKILGFLPNLLAAAIILVVGWFLARILQRVVTNLLLALGSERFAERIGLAKTLGTQGLSGLIGLIVFILILIPVLLAALQALSLEAITQPVSGMLSQILSALPALFGAALILAVAYIIGRIIAELVTNLLTSLGFNSVLVHLGIGTEPEEGQRTPSAVVGYLVLVAIMLFAIIEAAQILSFVLLADIVTMFTVFAGHVVLGLIVFGIGIYLANLAYRSVIASGVSQARILARAAQIAILIFAGAVGLRQMGLANEIINLAFGLLLGAIAVAVALAFGLGGREIAGRELDKWIESMKSEKP
jgi:hypothetical protein